MGEHMTLVIAHRGASAYAPENTMPAFELAVQLKADMLELDVQRSADGVLVCYHDFSTERWNGQQRLATDCTLAELQQLDIRGARIATLAEVCSFVRETGVRVNVEIKGLGIGEDIARLLREERVEEQILFSSFSIVALHEIEQAAPHIPRAYLMGTRTLRPVVRLRESWPFRWLRRANCAAWHPVYQIPLLRRLVPRVQRAGFTVNVWTVNDVAIMQKLLRIGVDGIITDVPDVLRRVIDEQQAVA
jgi:glycerophosphoryl diester phosphodiesterase